jgi:hypothetical protein
VGLPKAITPKLDNLRHLTIERLSEEHYPEPKPHYKIANDLRRKSFVVNRKRKYTVSNHLANKRN